MSTPRLLAALLLGLLAACASSALRPSIDRELVQQLRPGVDTADEVRATLGEPDAVNLLEGDQQEWLYWHEPAPLVVSEGAPAELPPPSDEHRTRELVRIVFFANGVVALREISSSDIRVLEAPGVGTRR